MKRLIIQTLLKSGRRDLANVVAYHVTAAKRLYYHGTSTVFAKRILSEGFVPNPKRKVWDSGTGKFESYVGTYASRDFEIAADAARAAAKKFNGRPVVFELQVETRGAMIDEDELPDMVDALNEGVGYDVCGYEEWYGKSEEEIDQYIEGDGIDEHADAGTAEWFQRYWQLSRSMKFDAQKKFRKHMQFRVYGLAYATLVAAARGHFYNDKPFDDDVREAEREVLKGIGSVGKLTENVKNLRVTEPITFRGANRIMAAIVRPEPEDIGLKDSRISPKKTTKKKAKKPAARPVFVVFGSPSSTMVSAAKQLWGNVKLVKKSLSQVPGLTDPYDDTRGWV